MVSGVLSDPSAACFSHPFLSSWASGLALVSVSYAGPRGLCGARSYRETEAARRQAPGVGGRGGSVVPGGGGVSRASTAWVVPGAHPRARGGRRVSPLQGWLPPVFRGLAGTQNSPLSQAVGLPQQAVPAPAPAPAHLELVTPGVSGIAAPRRAPGTGMWTPVQPEPPRAARQGPLWGAARVPHGRAGQAWPSCSRISAWEEMWSWSLGGRGSLRGCGGG